MENKKKKLDLVLFPGYFKVLGVALVLLAFVVPITIKLLHIEVGLDQKEFFREIVFSAINLGLFFFALSGNKIEDERTLGIRMKAMAFAFLWGVLYVVVWPLVNYFFKFSSKALSGQQIMLSMLIVYLIIFYLQKRKS